MTIEMDFDTVQHFNQVEQTLITLATHAAGSKAHVIPTDEELEGLPYTSIMAYGGWKFTVSALHGVSAEVAKKWAGSSPTLKPSALVTVWADNVKPEKWQRFSQWLEELKIPYITVDHHRQKGDQEQSIKGSIMLDMRYVDGKKLDALKKKHETLIAQAREDLAALPERVAGELRELVTAAEFSKQEERHTALAIAAACGIAPSRWTGRIDPTASGRGRVTDKPHPARGGGHTGGHRSGGGRKH